jgi:hypothetical protein
VSDLEPAIPPPAEVIVEKIEFEPFVPLADGVVPGPPPPTVIG